MKLYAGLNQKRVSARHLIQREYNIAVMLTIADGKTNLCFAAFLKKLAISAKSAGI